jgi:hypothetical protein
MRCVGATPIRHGEVIAVKDAARRLGVDLDEIDANMRPI